MLVSPKNTTKLHILQIRTIKKIEIEQAWQTVSKNKIRFDHEFEFDNQVVFPFKLW